MDCAQLLFGQRRSSERFYVVRAYALHTARIAPGGSVLTKYRGYKLYTRSGCARRFGYARRMPSGIGVRVARRIERIKKLAQTQRTSYSDTVEDDLTDHTGKAY